MSAFDSCDCGGKVVRRKVDIDYRYKGKLYVFQKAEIGVCRKCGERYYPGPLLERMEELCKHHGLIKRILKVPTFDLSRAG